MTDRCPANRECLTDKAEENPVPSIKFLTLYGYSWKFGEGPSTKSRVEDELPLEAQNTTEGKVDNLGDDIVSTS